MKTMDDGFNYICSHYCLLSVAVFPVWWVNRLKRIRIHWRCSVCEKLSYEFYRFFKHYKQLLTNSKSPTGRKRPRFVNKCYYLYIMRWVSNQPTKNSQYYRKGRFY